MNSSRYQPNEPNKAVYIKPEPVDDDSSIPNNITSHPSFTNLTIRTKSRANGVEAPEAVFDNNGNNNGEALYQPDHDFGKVDSYDPVTTYTTPGNITTQLAYRSRPLPGFTNEIGHSDGFGSTTTEITTARVRNLDGSRPPTECFHGSTYAKPCQHILICGHTITTPKPEPCRSDCKLSRFADSKVKSKLPFACKNPKCIRVRRAESLVFMPKRAGVKKATPATRKTLDNATRARVERELAKLTIDGANVLVASRTRRAADKPDFAKHDAPIGAANERERHNGYAVGGKRNQNADMFSISEDIYADMVADEHGVTIEQQDTISDRLPRAMVNSEVDPDADPDEAAMTGTTMLNDDEERYCTCDSLSHGFMLKCWGCKQYFHPGCVGKGLFAKERYEEADAVRAHRADISHFRSEGFDFTCIACDEHGLMSLSSQQKTVAAPRPTQLRRKADVARKTDLADQFSKIIAQKRDLEAD